MAFTYDPSTDLGKIRLNIPDKREDDYFFTDDMWLKSSLQHRSTKVHNISLIYGWEIIKDAKWYLVYNNVQEEDADSALDHSPAQSLFTKFAYTFRSLTASAARRPMAGKPATRIAQRSAYPRHVHKSY